MARQVKVLLSKVGPRPVRARLLTTGAPLSLEPASNGRTVIGGLPAIFPDPLAAVVEVEFESPPCAITQIDADWLEGAFSG